MAREIGFDEVGITQPAALQKGEQTLQSWVNEGRHGSMKYLEDFFQRKKNFYEDLPDAKSVIVLGVNYYTSHQSPDTSHQLIGKVARYAWGRDYHEVIRKRHEELIKKLRLLIGSGFKAKSCVDIQPLPERYAAFQAGLGFVGKHTGLLNKKFGPWLFLSEIITNIELENNLPEEGNCGTCVDCQKICPTGALDQDYKMDARLCIAYLTIEHKGVIPRELRPKIKDWIFGCDECFAICPFTSKSKESKWPELTASAGAGSHLLISDLFKHATNRDHEKTFQGTALLRTNRKQMLRNACIVLGNSHQPEAIPYLKKAMEDPSVLVRQHAAWGLGQINDPSAQMILNHYQNQETSAEVLEEIQSSLKN